MRACLSTACQWRVYLLVAGYCVFRGGWTGVRCDVGSGCAVEDGLGRGWADAVDGFVTVAVCCCALLLAVDRVLVVRTGTCGGGEWALDDGSSPWNCDQT